MEPFFAVEMLKIIVTGVVLLGIGVPFAVAFARRIAGPRTRVAALPGESAELLRSMENRLTRIEAAVDSIAVEVERVTEGQRFTVKLLSETHGSDTPRLGA